MGQGGHNMSRKTLDFKQCTREKGVKSTEVSESRGSLIWENNAIGKDRTFHYGLKIISGN